MVVRGYENEGFVVFVRQPFSDFFGVLGCCGGFVTEGYTAGWEFGFPDFFDIAELCIGVDAGDEELFG